MQVPLLLLSATSYWPQDFNLTPNPYLNPRLRRINVLREMASLEQSGLSLKVPKKGEASRRGFKVQGVSGLWGGSSKLPRERALSQEQPIALPSM